jgi:hypothetical protein
MENLILILGGLFVGLFVMVKLAEMSAKSLNPSALSGLTRWIIPLLAIGLVLQLIAYGMGYMGGNG